VFAGTHALVVSREGEEAGEGGLTEQGVKSLLAQGGVGHAKWLLYGHVYSGLKAMGVLAPPCPAVIEGASTNSRQYLSTIGTPEGAGMKVLLHNLLRASGLKVVVTDLAKGLGVSLDRWLSDFCCEENLKIFACQIMIVRYNLDTRFRLVRGLALVRQWSHPRGKPERGGIYDQILRNDGHILGTAKKYSPILG
jgi:hypothetical protein